MPWCSIGSSPENSILVSTRKTKILSATMGLFSSIRFSKRTGNTSSTRSIENPKRPKKEWPSDWENRTKINNKIMIRIFQTKKLILSKKRILRKVGLSFANRRRAPVTDLCWIRKARVLRRRNVKTYHSKYKTSANYPIKTTKKSAIVSPK